MVSVTNCKIECSVTALLECFNHKINFELKISAEIYEQAVKMLDPGA